MPRKKHQEEEKISLTWLWQNRVRKEQEGGGSRHTTRVFARAVRWNVNCSPRVTLSWHAHGSQINSILISNYAYAACHIQAFEVTTCYQYHVPRRSGRLDFPKRQPLSIFASL